MSKFLKYFNIVLYTFIFFQVIYIISPKEYQRSLIAYYVSYECRKLDKYQDPHLEKAKCSVIDKVMSSKTIINKMDIISRIEMVDVREHEKDKMIYLGYSRPKMSYFFDRNSGQDFIIVNSGTSSVEYFPLVHELNHLVDRHKVCEVEYDVTHLLKELRKEEYIAYFDEWPDIYGERTGDIIYDYYINNKKYMMSEGEVYARLSSLKNFLVLTNLISIDDTIQCRDIEELEQVIKCWHHSERLYFDVIDNWDFIPLLPLLKCDESEILAIL